ncbi:MAG TPA: histidine ammonia-lyase [Candidatus Bipolaricaulota bacterium]
MNSVRVTIKNLYGDLLRSLNALKQDPSRLQASRQVVERALSDGNTYYGINTGFGALARERIDAAQLKKLQHNLILSHAVGLGQLIPLEISRLMLHLKVHALGLGYSGISLETFERLMTFAKLDLIPAMPSRGSLGASGDLAPLAHMALPLLGYGFFWDEKGEKAVPALQVLHKHNLQPIELQPKDGLALINGTQMMCAYGASVLEKSLHLVKTADLLATMSLEALQGSLKPFDARIHEIRPHRGQQQVAENVRKLMVESQILESHRFCSKVQDPYSLRCAPQVHGASRDALAYAVATLETEVNAATDNPLVFENGDVLSGGNFHGQPLALALDFAAIALAELASISERRTYLLLEGHDGLPKLLMQETGINSGFMMLQYTAAALVSENKVLAHPASVDSIPSSLGQEDHVSMGSISATKLHQVYRNVEKVLAMELICAAQALDYRKPLRPGRGVEIAHQYVRSRIPHREKDYYFVDDLNQCIQMIQLRGLMDAVEKELSPLN